MAKKIDIDLVAFQKGIDKLKAYQTEWQSLKPQAPDTQGGGKTVNELEGMTKEYQNMLAAFLTLVDSTILFLETSKTNFEKTDDIGDMA